MTPPTGDPSLRATVSHALSWSFASTVLSRLGTLVTGIVLARLLDPHDYGVFTVAMVALVVLVNVNDLGLEQALVRWQGDIRAVAGTATTVIFGSSVLLFLLFWFLAPPLAGALHAPEATNIVRLMAAGVVVNGRSRCHPRCSPGRSPSRGGRSRTSAGSRSRPR